MRDPLLFYSVFTSQVLLISLIFPRIIFLRSRSVLRQFPPSAYPKLYPVSMEVIERKLYTYWYSNVGIAMVGTILLILGLLQPNREMLGWDNQSVLILFYFLQSTPIIFAEYSGFKYFKLMREADTRTRRSASLSPRRIVDFAPPALILATLGTYVAFVVLVLAIRQNPFPGFAGLWNILGATLLNLLYAGIIVWNVKGKKIDPHQADEDRHRQIKLTVRLMFGMSLVGTLFLGVFLILGAMDKRFLIDIFIMLFFQLCGASWLVTARIDTTNFDVYRNGSAEGKVDEQPAMT